MFPRRLIPFTRPWHRLLCQPRHFSTANGQHGTSDNTLNIWKDNLQRASAGDAIALCEVGWGHHQGLTPELQKSIPLAIENYVQSAKLGYAPAASLLADIHYYNHDDQKDWLLAMKYFKEVLQCTSPTERNDAYVRSQALQKLGVLAMRGIPNDIKKEARGGEIQDSQVPHREQSIAYFREALQLCHTHFGSSWAFLLAHDPPGLWEQLENEEKLLGDTEVLSRFMSGLVSTGQGGSGEASALSQLQYYTRSLRKQENDVDWVCQWQLEVLEKFPEEVRESGDWSVTYFTSFLRIFMEPIVQRAVSQGRGGVPKVVCIGSGLGNLVAWPAIAFGFRGVGFDILRSCTKKAGELYSTAVDVITKKHELLQKYKQSQLLAGQESLMGADGSVNEVRVGTVVFETMDVLKKPSRVQKECQDANIIWLSDHTWSQEAQQAIEATTLAGMSSGALMVLYRPPHFPPKNTQLMKAVPVATSWSPSVDMYIICKE